MLDRLLPIWDQPDIQKSENIFGCHGVHGFVRIGGVGLRQKDVRGPQPKAEKTKQTVEGKAKEVKKAADKQIEVMARLPVVKPGEVVRVLEKLGFVEVRHRDSHKHGQSA
jgi:hypothetical protein